jgi:hypothetical protein
VILHNNDSASILHVAAYCGLHEYADGTLKTEPLWIEDRVRLAYLAMTVTIGASRDRGRTAWNRFNILSVLMRRGLPLEAAVIQRVKSPAIAAEDVSAWELLVLVLVFGASLRLSGCQKGGEVVQDLLMRGASPVVTIRLEGERTPVCR